MFNFYNPIVKKALSEAEFGIERETLRVTGNGKLAHTPHPFGTNKNIDRDFCENQIEIISDVFDTAEALSNQLNSLMDEIYAVIGKQDELLWPFSNPPYFMCEDDIPVANFVGALKSKSVYREYLAQKYGKQKMLFSGIHLNISFKEKVLQMLFEQSGENNYRVYKDKLYFYLAKRLTQYSSLIVFLTAASPLTDASLGIESNLYASVRCGEHGYWNSFVPLLDYTTLETYIQSIEGYINRGDLKSVSELYYPVRVKPCGTNSLQGLRSNGINHLELRVLDVNPLSRVGIFCKDIRFIHLLMLYFLSMPDFDFDVGKQTKAIQSIKAAALYRNEEAALQAKIELNQIKRFADENFPGFSDVVDYQIKKLEKGGRYAEIISERFGDDYMSNGIALARKYAGE